MQINKNKILMTILALSLFWRCKLPSKVVYQMPVDARMFSIFLFFNFGIIAGMLITPSSSISQGMLNLLMKKLGVLQLMVFINY